MSYCVGLKLNCGLVFMSDTLTNGGLDNISHYPKTFSCARRSADLSVDGSNLATSQAVISTLTEQNESRSEETPSILRAPSMFQVAQTVSRTLAEVIGVTAKGQMVADSTFSATFILGGQIKGSKMSLYLIYPEGNFIEVSEEHPFFQIGETKYGRPILVRAFEPKMSFEDAVKLLMVSFDLDHKSQFVGGTTSGFTYLRQGQHFARQIDEDRA